MPLKLQKDDEEQQDLRDSYVDTKPRYSSDTLMGHWNSQRYGHDISSRSAIVPCLLIDEGCEQHLTTNQSAYRPKEFVYLDLLVDHRAMQFNTWRNMMVQRSNYCHEDGEQYISNYTTMNTLSYSLWPRMERELRCRMLAEGKTDLNVLKTRWRPEGLDSYGNNSCKTPPPARSYICEQATTYKHEYKPKRAEIPQSIRPKDELLTVD
ncbi:maker735 [Drosophila busckii]|uniref:Maker735 n=1 Tax=Drosophila busckii TaxID=30019 RepID=A0A0M3QWQ2_DROBS|nr:maker735 [Drosophila busckii]